MAIVTMNNSPAAIAVYNQMSTANSNNTNLKVCVVAVGNSK